MSNSGKILEIVGKPGDDMSNVVSLQTENNCSTCRWFRKQNPGDKTGWCYYEPRKTYIQGVEIMPGAQGMHGKLGVIDITNPMRVGFAYFSLLPSQAEDDFCSKYEIRKLAIEETN